MQRSMKNLLFLVLGIVVLSPLYASAGALYGTVRIGQAPAAGVVMDVACPRFNPPGQPPPRVTAHAVTDTRGSFSLRVEADGRCEMRLQRNNQVGNAFEVFASNNSLRLDLEIDNAMNRVR